MVNWKKFLAVAMFVFLAVVGPPATGAGGLPTARMGPAECLAGTGGVAPEDGASCRLVWSPSGGTLYITGTGGERLVCQVRLGATGPQVAWVEWLLARLGYNPGRVDGIFSRVTRLAVEAFQRDHGLSSTGVVDARTLAVMWPTFLALFRGAAPPVTAPPEPPQLQPQSPSQPQLQGLTPEEELMFSLVNQERTAAGVAPLKIDMRLVELARQKSEDMVRNQYFAHVSPTYGSPFDMMRAAGISYRTAGENIAGAPSVEAAHRALMGSEGHRRNILNPALTHVGIGVARGGPYGMVFTQMFLGN